MADTKVNLQRAKRDFGKAKFNFMRTKVTSGVDDYTNEVASLLAKGRRNRNVGRPKPSSGGGNNMLGLTMLPQGPIAEITSFLDPVRTREGLEAWVRKLIPAQISDHITRLYDPTSEDSRSFTKIDVTIRDSLMDLSFSNLPSFNGEPCPALLQEYMRVIVGLMEKFYQQQESDMSFRGRQIQLVLWCELIDSPEEGISPAFKIKGDDTIVICSNYVVSLASSPTLRLHFQDIGDDPKPDFTREIRQDSLTLWRNDTLAHGLEATGAGSAILLSVGLIDPNEVFTN